MNSRQLFLALLLAVPGLAQAGSCPKLMQEIDALLSEANDIPEQLETEVLALRDEGEGLHEAGDHAQSEQLLGKALALLKQAN